MSTVIGWIVTSVEAHQYVTLITTRRTIQQLYIIIFLNNDTLLNFLHVKANTHLQENVNLYIPVQAQAAQAVIL